MLVRKVYLQPFFEELRGQIEGLLARAGVELVMEIEDRGTARFDEGKITRVVHNLARNAAAAMAAQAGGTFPLRGARAAGARSRAGGRGRPAPPRQRGAESEAVENRPGAGAGARGRRSASGHDRLPRPIPSTAPP